MTKILVTYNTNWADEFDVVSSLIMTREEWKEICEDTKSLFKYKTKIEHYFGNYDITYDNYEQWIACYKISELTPIERKVLTKFKNLIDNNRFFIPEFYIEDHEPETEAKVED